MSTNSRIRFSILGAFPWTYIRQQHNIGSSPTRSITLVKIEGGSGGSSGLTKGDYRDLGGGLRNFQDYRGSGQYGRTASASIRWASNIFINKDWVKSVGVNTGEAAAFSRSTCFNFMGELTHYESVKYPPLANLVQGTGNHAWTDNKSATRKENEEKSLSLLHLVRVKKEFSHFKMRHNEND